MILPPKTVINEGSSCKLRVNYLDMNGSPYVPSTAQWRIDDVATAEQIQNWVTYTPSGTSDILLITAELNALLAAPGTRPYEDRQVVVQTVDANDNPDVKMTEYSIRALVYSRQS